MNQELKELLGIEETQPLNDEQVEKLYNRFRNIYASKRILIDDDHIVFPNQEIHKNWLYYAGFEYIQQGPAAQITIPEEGICYIVYNRSQNQRVEEILDMFFE